MGNDAEDTFHAGRLIARRLKASGIDTVFTLSGGHLFSLYDGCRSEGIRLIDTRHEQTAAFAAEGWSEGDTSAGRGGADRGPGRDERDERNGCRPAELVAAAGSRRPGARGRWGMGSLQEIDPCAIRGTADSIRRHRAVGRGGQRPDRRRTAGHGRSAIGGGVHRHSDGPRIFRRRRHRTARRPDHVTVAVSARWRRARPRGQPAWAGAQRPVIMAGTNVWWGHAEAALLRLAEERRIPVLMNGMARGTVPADHPLAFSRARSKALGEADVAVVIGVPMDFRLGFGGVFGPDTQLIVADRVQPERGHPRPVAAELYGDLSSTLTVLSDTPAGRNHRPRGVDRRSAGDRDRGARRRARRAWPTTAARCTRMRVYAELAPLLDRDAIVVVDAGDFGSYAGRVIDSYVPGCVARQRSVRMPRFGSRLRAGRQISPARPSGHLAARRRRPSDSAAWNGTRWPGTTFPSSR